MHQQLMHNTPTPTPTPAATAFNNTATITTDHIQQYLNENKALILNILDNQNTGKFTECAENQSRLQHNLMYLAAIADSQPKPSSIHLQQQLQSQHMLPQHPTFSVMQQHALQSQLGIGYGGTGTHTHIPPTLEAEGLGAFPDFSQSILGEAKAAACSNNTTITSTCAEDGHNPQKKGKLSTAAT